MIQLEVRFDPLVEGALSPPIVQFAPKRIMTTETFSRTFIKGEIDSADRHPGFLAGLFSHWDDDGEWYDNNQSVFRLYAHGVEDRKGNPLAGYKVILTVLHEEGAISVSTHIKVEQAGTAFHLPRAVPRGMSTTYRLDGLSAKDKLRPSTQRFEDDTSEDLDDMVGYPGGTRCGGALGQYSVALVGYAGDPRST